MNPTAASFDRVDRIARVDRVWVLGSCALYLILCASTASVWEHAHDEGVSYEQALGPLVVASDREAPTPIHELYAQLASPHSLQGVLRELSAPGGMHPPAYYLLLNGWSRLFGTQQLAWALPAMLAGLGALFAMRGVARELFGAAAGRAAMLLLAASPWFASYSVLLRPYGIATCVALGATLAALRMASPPQSRRAAGAFALLSVLGLYLIYHYAFVLLWHVAFLLVAAAYGESALGGESATRGERGESQGASRRQRLGLLLAASLAIGVLYGPWLGRLLFHLDITSARPWYFSGWLPLDAWPRRGALLLAVFGLGELAVEPSAGLLRGALALLGLGSIAAGGAALATRWRSAPSTLRAAIATAPLLPVSLVAADWLRDSHTLFYSKTSFGALPLLILALAGVAGWLRRWHPRAPAAFVACWAALFVVAGAWNVAQRSATANDAERLAAHLAATAGGGRLHRLVVPTARHGYLIPLLLAMRDAGVDGVEVQIVEPERFDAWLLRALRGPSGGLLTLANLRVLGVGGERSWPQDQLLRGRDRAILQGWAVRPLRMTGDPSERPGPAARQPTLWLTPPLRPKYFSM